MDDLIVVIVRLIARWLSNQSAAPTGRTARMISPGPSGNTVRSTPPASPPRLSTMPGVLRRAVMNPRGRKQPPKLVPTPVKPVAAVTPIASRVATAHREIRSVNAIVGTITPATLRRQIVVNEILLPPLALRGE